MTRSQTVHTFDVFKLVEPDVCIGLRLAHLGLQRLHGFGGVRQLRVLGRHRRLQCCDAVVSGLLELPEFVQQPVRLSP